MRRLTASWRKAREFCRLAGLAGLTIVIPGTALVLVAAIHSPVAPDSLVTLTAAEESVTGLYVGQANASSFGIAGSEPITVTVAPAGAFTVTVEAGAVPLMVNGSTAAGTLQEVTVTDTRNYYPGWSVTGQAADFTTRRGPAISGNHLGWTPHAVDSLGGCARLGGTVAPAAPGLGTTPATLASAAAGCGFGVSKLSARLTLDIPAFAAGRRYTGMLTITYVESGLGQTTARGRTAI